MSRRMGRVIGLLTAALVVFGPTAVVVASASEGAGPVTARKAASRDQWLADVKTAMRGSRAYVRERAASGDEMLAINFDIDNTVIATYYDGGGPIPQMLRFSRFLTRHDVAMVFNTGRSADQRSGTLRQLQRTGFPVAALCLRAKGETLPHGKQRCRDRFIGRGYTLIANVGNNDTDFEGDGYERAYVLPNYGGVLG